MKTTHYPLRLKPHQDLKMELEAFVKQKQLKAAAIVTCVGSLEEVNLRFANQPAGTKISGRHEILSLVGTVSVNGSHLHLSAADGTGKTLGGHLLEGNKIFTTAEIVLVELENHEFARELDAETTFKELSIKNRN